MSGLEKATLTKLSNDKADIEVGDPIPVQFNPSSLRLTLSNNTEGGQSTGRSQRQFTGNSSTELAFDLVFDTADEDDGSGGARSVREKTSAVEQFVLSQGSGSERKSPPRVKFHWGELLIKGVITSVSLDFDLFAPDGTPLRAKMSVSIKEQDAKYELLQAGPGSSSEGGAPAPGGGSGTGPGSKGGGAKDPRSNRSIAALAGESAAELAARIGLDPGAWRGLAAGLDGTLSLSAGIEIDFDASIGVSAGIGIRAGVTADIGASLEASLGLLPSAGNPAGASAGAGPSAAPGFALSAAGGVNAAVETVKIARAEAASAATLRSFAALAGGASAAIVSGGRSPAVSGAAAGVAAGDSARSSGLAPTAIRAGVADPRPATYAPPRGDSRATSFGFGVPLRRRVTGAAESSQGVVALRPYARTSEAPTTRDPTIPGWLQLPPISAAAAAAADAASPCAKSGSRQPAAPPARSAPMAASPQPRGGRPAPNPCGCGSKGGAR